MVNYAIKPGFLHAISCQVNCDGKTAPLTYRIKEQAVQELILETVPLSMAIWCKKLYVKVCSHIHAQITGLQLFMIPPSVLSLNCFNVWSSKKDIFLVKKKRRRNGNEPIINKLKEIVAYYPKLKSRCGTFLVIISTLLELKQNKHT